MIFSLVVVVMLRLSAAEKSDSCEGGSLCMSDEKRLIKHLLKNYEQVGLVGRPVTNTSETVKVTYGLALIQILDLDEKNQVLTTNVWSRYTWTDMFLRWNPELFGNVQNVRVPVDSIWQPDIVLYNYADTRLEEKRKTMAVVESSGAVLWIPPAIFKSTCSIDIQIFPYDTQHCLLKFGSWTYDGYHLDLNFYDNKHYVDLNDYTKSNEWTIVKHPAIRNVLYYACCHEPYIDLTFNISLRRTSAFYTYILILPCVLLSILTLSVFCLPPGSPAKVVLGMNIFIAFFLLLQILAEATPPASAEVPLIGIFFCINMVLMTLSTFLSVIVVNLHFRVDKKREVPKIFKMLILDGLARVLCMRDAFWPEGKPPEPSQTHAVHSAERKNSKEKRKIKSPVLAYNKWESPSINHSAESPLATRCQTPERGWSDAAFEADVREIKRALRGAWTRMLDKDAQTHLVSEWRMIAIVLDRTFFLYLSGDCCCFPGYHLPT